jgi:hypothetical protein
MSLDQKRKSFDKDDKNNDYDDEIDEGDEEMSEQASSSKPSQQSVIQRKPNSNNNNTSKTLCYNCSYDTVKIEVFCVPSSVLSKTIPSRPSLASSNVL